MDVRPGPLGSFPSSLTTAATGVFFAADDGAHGVELWKTDGTAAGTAMVQDINLGGGSLPHDLVAVANGVYFVADDGVHGAELWFSDGTAAGTRLVEDLLSGAGSSRPGFLIAAGPVLYLVATDATGEALFAVRGTTVTRVKGRGVDARTPLLGVGLDAGVLLFAAHDPNDAGLELFESDGTDGGAVLFADLNPRGDSSPAGFQAFGDLAYFDATTEEYGRELYACELSGCQRMTDIAPAGLSSNPGPLSHVGKHVAFAATSVGFDRELWALDDPRLPDNTPPLVAPQLSAAQQRGGWYTSSVTVTWIVSDPDSAVQSANGCSPVTVSQDTTGQALTCTATSEGGTTVVTVTVKADLTPPSLACPPSVTAHSLEPLPVTFVVTATDAIDPSPRLRVTPPSGSLFPTGSTTVVATAVDFSGNQGSCEFEVEVLPPEDQVKPFLPKVSGCAAAPGGLLVLAALLLLRRRRR
jgi:ELWxxDGT repeat protein